MWQGWITDQLTVLTLRSQTVVGAGLCRHQGHKLGPPFSPCPRSCASISQPCSLKRKKMIIWMSILKCQVQQNFHVSHWLLFYFFIFFFLSEGEIFFFKQSKKKFEINMAEKLNFRPRIPIFSGFFFPPLLFSPL